MGKPKSKSKPQELVNVGGHYFPKVKKARQALKEHAEEIYQEYRQAIQTALSAGESLIGAITVTASLRFPISMPTPPNAPDISS